MANRTGQSIDLPQLRQPKTVGAIAPRVQYATKSAAATNAGKAEFTLAETLKGIGRRVEDRLDEIAAVNAAKEGALAVSDGKLPELLDDSTIRGRYFNQAARDTALTEFDLRGRKALSDFEKDHGADPVSFGQKSDDWLKGVLPDLQRFDPVLAKKYKAEYELRQDAAMGRVEQRHLAVVRDRQLETALRHQLAVQDELGAQAAALFSGEGNGRVTLTQMMENAAKIIDTVHQIGPDGAPLYTARQRVDAEIRLQEYVSEKVGLAWLRTQPDLAAGLAALADGTASFDLVDSDTGEIETITLEQLGVNASYVPEISRKAQAEFDALDAGNKSAREENYSNIDLEIEQAPDLKTLDALSEKINIKQDDLGGVVKANNLRKRIYQKSQKFIDEIGSVSRGSAFASGDAYLNPSDSAAKKDFDAWYNTQAIPRLPGMDVNARNTYLANMLDTVKVVPTRLAGDITSAARSSNIDEVVAAADLIDRVRGTNPHLMAAFNDRDTARLEMVRGYIEGGYTSQEAFDRADKMLDPANAALVENRKLALKGQKIDYRAKSGQAFDPGFFTKLLPGTQGFKDLPEGGAAGLQSVQLETDYRRAYESQYILTGDEAIAEKHAAGVVRGLYGVTEINGRRTLMKYAPEAYYNVRGDDDSWLREQMLEEAKKVAAKNIMPPDFKAKRDVLLVPDPYVTPRTAKNGAPAYKMMYLGDDGALRDMLGPDEYFVFEPGKRRQQLVDEARRKAEGK